MARTAGRVCRRSVSGHVSAEHLTVPGARGHCRPCRTRVKSPGACPVSARSHRLVGVCLHRPLRLRFPRGSPAGFGRSVPLTDCAGRWTCPASVRAYRPPLRADGGRSACSAGPGRRPARRPCPRLRGCRQPPYSTSTTRSRVLARCGPVQCTSATASTTSARARGEDRGMAGAWPVGRGSAPPSVDRRPRLRTQGKITKNVSISVS